MAAAHLAVVQSAPPPALDDLLSLARSRSTDDRQRLLLGITALCDARPPSGELSPVLSEIFLVLARQAERDVRRILSERLASADWAPRALVNVLALDEIEIARPIIAQSPLLRDDDLLRILIEATLDHQIEVARRPNLGGRVCDVIIERGEPATLATLAGNRTADVSAEGMRRLVDHSRRIAALRSPLTRHPRLSEANARQLFQWVGAALRQSIAERFAGLDDGQLGVEVDAAVQAAFERAAPPPPEPSDAEREEMERRLVAKLQEAGQLRAGYLIKAVRERRLSLFRHALAALGGYTHCQVVQALNHASPEALYYACASVGIDRAVFPPLLDEVRKLSGGAPGGSGEPVWTRGSISPTSAARAFRAIIPGDPAV